MNNNPWLMVCLGVGAAVLLTSVVVHSCVPRQEATLAPAEVARLEKQEHQRNAVIGGTVAVAEGWQAWVAAKRERRERAQTQQ